MTAIERLYKKTFEPVVMPFFPMDFSPSTVCTQQHIPTGDNRVCMACHQSGIDGKIGKGTRSMAKREDEARKRAIADDAPTSEKTVSIDTSLAETVHS